MGIEIPGSLRWVADKVLGTDWPDADETAMQRCADHWDNASVMVETLDMLGDEAIRGLLGAVDGQVNDAIAGFWDKIGGDGGAMKELMDACDQLADMLDGAAQDVRRAKLAIIANLVTLAASLVMAAATVWAFGAGAVAGAAATAAARLSIQMIIQQLTRTILLRIAKEMVISAAISGGLKVLTENGLQVFENAKGLRDGYDVGDVAQAGANGAVKGVTQVGIKSGYRLGAHGELSPEFKGSFFSVDKAKDVGKDMKTGESIVGGIVGGQVANATVGKPEEGVGSRIKGLIDESESSLDLPAGSPQQPSSLDLPAHDE